MLSDRCWSNSNLKFLNMCTFGIIKSSNDYSRYLSAKICPKFHCLNKYELINKEYNNVHMCNHTRKNNDRIELDLPKIKINEYDKLDQYRITDYPKLYKIQMS